MHKPRELGFDCLAEKVFSEFGITLDPSANGLVEIVSQGHGAVI
jgi:hypothetical protein